MEDFSADIVELYSSVLLKEKSKFSIKDQEVSEQIEIMKDAYLPNSKRKMVDYNKPAARCAYLFKYTMCYTGMVNCFMTAAAQNCSQLKFLYKKKNLKICSLGGGPGTDIVGIMNVLAEVFECLSYRACVIDYKENWKITFSSVIEELQNRDYGGLYRVFSPNIFEWKYMQADLLRTPFNMNITQVIEQSDFLSMVKFISAAACDQSRQMVKEVFKCMKPGAIILFIDNAAGGFLEMLQEEANRCGINSIYGPLKHIEYEDREFFLERFGYRSQSKTTVSMQIWKKGSAQNFALQSSLAVGQTGESCYDIPLSSDFYSQGENSVLNQNKRGNLQKRCFSLFYLFLIIMIIFFIVLFYT